MKLKKNTKLAHILYSARKNASAPVDIAKYVSLNNLISLILASLPFNGVVSSPKECVNSSIVTLYELYSIINII